MHLMPRRAELYRHEADGRWERIGKLGRRADWAEGKVESWMRLTALASYRGRLFAGTGSCRGVVGCSGASCQVNCSGPQACAMGVGADAAGNNISCRGNGACAGRVRCSGNTCTTDCTGPGACAMGACCSAATCTRMPLNLQCR